ncbi:MAG TPA: heavy metal-associated domain-containing protein [Syntrophales bacterium]|nr:heavy metal-associated domain-containing protein [Syntrophales bacterium]
MDTVRVKVDDADCESCMKVIKKKLRTLNGVRDVSVDVKNKEVIIKYDNPQLCLDDFTCAIEDLGYNKVQIVP